VRKSRADLVIERH